MAGSLLLLLLYLVSAVAVFAAAAWLGRTIPKRVAILLALLPILFFLPTFVTTRTPAPVDHCASIPPWNSIPHPVARNSNLNDAARQALPWAQAAREAWAHPSLPWRDRWNGCGTPLSANGQSAVYAPWTIASLLLPLSKFLPYVGVFKLLLALVGGWLWMRELGLSEHAALLGSLLLGFCLSMSLWLFWPQSGVIALWPWSLFLIERLTKTFEPRVWGALVPVFALWPLSGHLESAASGAAFLFLWLLGRAAFGEPGIARALGRTATAGFAAAGLSAFSLAPQILAILASNRLAVSQNPFWRPLLSWKPHWPRWSAPFLTTLWPRSFGDEIASPMLPGSPASYPELALGYIGIIGACFLLLFLRPGTRHASKSWGLLVPLSIGLLTATLSWPFGEISELVPGLRYMFPIRYLSWVAVAGAGLAAFELDRLRRDVKEHPKSALRLAIGAGVLGTAALLVFGVLRTTHRVAGGEQSQIRALIVTELVLSILAVGAALRAARLIPDRTFLIGITILAVGELFYQGERFYRYLSPDLLYPPTPLIRFLQSRTGSFRVLGDGLALYPNSNVFARAEEVRTHDPTERRDYVEFLQRTCGYIPDAYFKDIRDVNAAALDFLNVQYLVSSPNREAPSPKWRTVYRGNDGSVFENTQVLPRAFSPEVIGSVSSTSSKDGWMANAIQKWGPEFDRVVALRDWRERAYVLASNSQEHQNPKVTVSDYVEDSLRISFRTVAATKAVVVLSVVQDGGWTAIDERGMRLETSRANGPFLAVFVPGGGHRIRLRYVEPGFTGGLICSILTILLPAAFWWMRLSGTSERVP